VADGSGEADRARRAPRPRDGRRRLRRLAPCPPAPRPGRRGLHRRRPVDGQARRGRRDAELIDRPVSEALGLLCERPPFDEVYHLAAAVGVDLVMREPVRSIETNVEQTASLLRFVSATGAGPVLLTSSSEVYGKPTRRVFSEDDDVVYGPTSITRWSYACAKAADEYLALGHHALGHRPLRRRPPVQHRRARGSWVSTAWSCRGSCARRWRASPSGSSATGRSRGASATCATWSGRCPRLLGDPACHGRVFNLGSDEPITILELAETVRRVLGSSSEIEFVPYERPIRRGTRTCSSAARTWRAYAPRSVRATPHARADDPRPGASDLGRGGSARHRRERRGRRAVTVFPAEIRRPDEPRLSPEMIDQIESIWATASAPRREAGVPRGARGALRQPAQPHLARDLQRLHRRARDLVRGHARRDARSCGAWRWRTA
jgi:hypothetical protein